jgi:hypothetical protein
VYYDLGENAQIARIRWKFLRSDAADLYRIQVSDDATNWETLISHGNAAAADQWQTHLQEVEARYVRFIFVNSGNDANIGYLSEVRFYTS